MSKNNLFNLLTAIVFLVGLFFWLQNLDADPQMNFSGISQGLSTDPAHYVYHSRNKILFDEFDPFDDPRWTVFQHSLVSLIAYITFSTYAVSNAYANIVGVLLSFVGLIFFLGGINNKKFHWLRLIFALLFVTNIILYTYGRVPFLENALIFYVGIIFFVNSRYPNKLSSVIISGILISLATLTAKAFGLLFFPALCLSIYFSSYNNRISSIVWLSISTVISFIVSSFFIYGSNFKYFLGLISEQGVEIRGFPDGLRSPWAFFEHLLNFGAENRLFYINFDLLIYLAFALFIIAIRLRQGTKVSSLPFSIRFPMFLIGIGIIVFSTINYSPLRYSLFLIPLILALFVDSIPLLTQEISRKKQSRYPLILYLFIFWFLLVDILILIFYQDKFPMQILCWITFPIAILFTYLFDRFVPFKNILNKNLWIGFVSLVIICGMTINFIRYTEHGNSLKNYTIKEASIDLGLILGDEAVLSGSYAPILTLGNDNLKSYIHQFSLIDQPSDLFNKIPVTHIALNKSERNLAFKLYPKLKNCKPVVTYWLRNTEVSVYYLGDVYSNSQTALYNPTYFEKATKYELDGFSDSAYMAINTFMDKESSSKSAILLQAQLLLKMGDYDTCISLIKNLTLNHPTDSFLLIQCARTIQYISLRTNNRSLYNLAKKYYESAVKVNAPCIQHAQRIFKEIQSQFQ